MLTDATNSTFKPGTGGFLNPQEILEKLPVDKGMKIADFGCGAGYFTILLAKIVGEDGKVYALDVLQTSLESVRSSAKMEGIFNIEAIWANLEVSGGSKLSPGSMDFVLLSNILFQSEQKANIIKEAWRVLKGGGKMAVIEWHQDLPIVGPKEGYRVSADVLKELAAKEGFKFESNFSAGVYHYGLIFSK